MSILSKSYIPADKSSDMALNFLFPGLENNENFQKGEILSYFNIVYHDGLFLDAIEDLLKNHDSYSLEGCYGYYPDCNSGYPSDCFEEGLIRFAVGLDDERYGIYVTEREFFRYAKEACLRFIRLHPEHRDFVMDIVDNWKPKYPDKYPE